MKFFHLIPQDTNYNFVGKSKIFLTFSAVGLLSALFLVFQKGFNFGIDFTGGTVVQVKFSEAKSAADVRALLNEVGEPNTAVVALGDADLEYMLTTRDVTKLSSKSLPPIAQKLVEKLGSDNLTIQKTETVGPKVGDELKWAAIRSLFYSIVLIMIYIWFRFDLTFAPGATLAMIHDLIFIAGYYVLTGNEFNITSVAALLTIAGYSVNDTIVIYDRVREIFKAGANNVDLGPTINKAINLTLSRTIITSILTLVALIAIVFFCTGEIRDFAEAMCLGVLIGTYSTIYIASPFTIFAQKMMDKRKAAK